MDKPPPRGSPDVWKWVAGLLAATLLASVPSMAYTITIPRRADYERLQGQVVQNQIAVAQLQQQLLGQSQANADSLDALSGQIAELRSLIQQR